MVSVSEKHEQSSANISAKKSSILFETNIPLSVSDFKYGRSFINREKMIGERTQPCRFQMLHARNLVNESFILMQDFN